MATKGLSVEFRENSTKQGKQYKGDALDKTQRRTLQTIQYSAVGDNRLIGQGNMRDENGKSKKKIKSCVDPIKIFEDENLESELAPLEDRGTQTVDDGQCDNDELAEADQEALELMGGDAVPEQYWKLLAEERRQALNDTLEENEQLHIELDSLKEENEKLTDIASKAEYLSSILQSVVSSDEDNDSVDDDDYKTGDEQLCNEDDNNSVQEACDSDSEGSVYCAAANVVPDANKSVETSDSDCGSDSGSTTSGETVLWQGAKKSGKDHCTSKRFSGDWVNVELNDEKVASTEIIQAEALAVLKEDVSS